MTGREITVVVNTAEVLFTRDGEGFAVSGFREEMQGRWLAIPAAHDGLPVLSIRSGAFLGNELITVVIPDNVRNIGWNAFADNQLSRLIIGNNVTCIGDEAFARNTSLTMVTVPKGTSVAPSAFDPWMEIIRC